MTSEDDGSVEARIREEAYRLWLAEGQPDGRCEDHWRLASETIAREIDTAAPSDAAAFASTVDR